jgi:hypothetical protein
MANPKQPPPPAAHTDDFAQLPERLRRLAAGVRGGGSTLQAAHDGIYVVRWGVTTFVGPDPSEGGAQAQAAPKGQTASAVQADDARAADDEVLASKLEAAADQMGQAGAPAGAQALTLPPWVLLFAQEALSRLLSKLLGG